MLTKEMKQIIKLFYGEINKYQDSFDSQVNLISSIVYVLMSHVGEHMEVNKDFELTFEDMTVTIKDIDAAIAKIKTDNHIIN